MPDGDTASLVDALFSDVRCLRQWQPDLPMIVLCDEAAELWKMLGAEFTGASLGGALRHLVDLWHVLEKVGKALRARYDEARTRRELQRWKLRLLNGSQAASALQAELQALLTFAEPRTGKDAVDEAVTYSISPCSFCLGSEAPMSEGPLEQDGNQTPWMGPIGRG